MKVVDYQVVMREFPDEITLAMNISNCPCHCKGCHSSYLAEDIGKELTKKLLCEYINKNPGITCVGFMGGDAYHDQIIDFARIVKSEYPSLKVGWYSGRDYLDSRVFLKTQDKKPLFDYVKFGRWDESRGPLNKQTTNQVLLYIHDDIAENITYRLQQIQP